MRQNNILQVFYGDRQVGTLVLNADHKVAFEYTDTWLEEGFSISPFYLPLKRQVFVPVKTILMDCLVFFRIVCRMHGDDCC